ncbi:MAG: hypothetical protein ABIQ17_07110 [Candidatus Limnocylindrales bacterium]
MARAKRTDRADARRRFRQVHDDPNLTEDAAELEDAGATPEPQARRSPSAPGRPIGFRDSMGAAFHRPDIRADIAALPMLLRTRAFLIPLGLVVVGVIGIVAVPSSPVAGLFFQLLVLPPAMAPIFIAGFFAKRASYLLGLIIAVVDVLGYTLFIYAALPTLSTTPVDAANQQELVISAIAVGPLSGIFFAAGAAWYRRFLSFSSAQRARSRAAEKPAKANRSGRR